jgi:molybdopterin/thiamine biosynthesis adenylyltransferase
MPSRESKMTVITIVGVGALGSHVAQFLRNVEAELRIIDMDKIETKNTKSQFHSVTNVGKSKATSLQQTLNFLFRTKVSTFTSKLVANNVNQLLGGSTLILDCLDNAESRRLVQSYAQEHNIPCLHGALAANGAFGQVLWTDKFRIDSEVGSGAATCEDGRHLPFIAMVSSLMAQSAQTFLTNQKKLNFQIHPAGIIFI